MLTRRGMIAGGIALLGPWGCECNEGGAKGTGSGPGVVSSIFPVHDLVRRIGGDAVTAELLLTPGQSAHDFNPAPTVAKTVARSKAMFSVGLQLDEWAAKLAEAAGSGLSMVRLGETCPSKTFAMNHVGGHSHIEEPHDEPAHDDHDHHEDGHDHEEDHGHQHEDGHDHRHEGEHHHEHEKKAAPEPEGHHHHDGADPHVWLAVPNAMKMAETIATVLSKALPKSTATFEANLVREKAELQKLDAEIRQRVKALKKKTLVTFHGSFGYFAAEYGLNIAAVIEPFPGKQPSAAYLKEVLQALKGKRVAALFTEPQLDKRPAEVLAKEAKLPVRELDPLGGVAGRDSYAALMRYNLAQLAEVMG